MPRSNQPLLPSHLSAARSRILSLLLCFSLLFFISSSSSSFSPTTEKSLQDPLQSRQKELSTKALMGLQLGHRTLYPAAASTHDRVRTP